MFRSRFVANCSRNNWTKDRITHFAISDKISTILDGSSFGTAETVGADLPAPII
ncbi:unnamed protein product [Tenebrio molitor]|nr:unnamed protein product [Tenebrio molitor]